MSAKNVGRRYRLASSQVSNNHLDRRQRGERGTSITLARQASGSTRMNQVAEVLRQPHLRERIFRYDLETSGNLGVVMQSPVVEIARHRLAECFVSLQGDRRSAHGMGRLLLEPR